MADPYEDYEPEEAKALRHLFSGEFEGLNDEEAAAKLLDDGVDRKLYCLFAVCGAEQWVKESREQRDKDRAEEGTLKFRRKPKM